MNTPVNPDDMQYFHVREDFMKGGLNYIDAIEELERRFNLSSTIAESIVEQWEYELDTKRT